MAFNIALTGIDTSQTYLDVTANNIANAASIGFKKSRGEFADIYSSGVYQNVNVSVGQGSKTAAVSQQFEQGSMQRTSSVLDLSIDGTGFFATSKQRDNYDFQYTRAGAFKLDSDSYIVNSFGDYLRAFPVDPDTGKTTTISMAATDAVQVPTSLGEPEATENIDFSVNFPVETDPKEAKDLSKFDPKDSTTYNYSTASIFYDSVGTRHTLNVYYAKPGREMMLASGESGMVDLSVVYDPNGPMDYKTAWAAFYEINGTPIQPLNADTNDVEGFAYEARNLTTPEYPNGRALDPNFSNLTDPPIATSISVDNTKVGEGKIYPGKVASETPDDIIPDNATTAVSKEDYHIVNGDKTNEDRPKDFWRCEFLFMGRGETDFFEPTDPVILQPLGFVEDKIGETKTALGTPTPLEPVEIKDTKLVFDPAQFHAPREGETGKLTFEIDITTPITSITTGNPTFNPYKFTVDIDSTIKTVPQYAKAVQEALNTLKSSKVVDQITPSATNTNPPKYKDLSVGDALTLDGYTVEVDSITGDIVVEQNITEQQKNGGETGPFKDVISSYGVTNVGVPILDEPSIMTYTVGGYTPNTGKNTSLHLGLTITGSAPQDLAFQIGPTVTGSGELNDIQTGPELVEAIIKHYNDASLPGFGDIEFIAVPDNPNQFQIKSSDSLQVKVDFYSLANGAGTGTNDNAFTLTDSEGKSVAVANGVAGTQATPIELSTIPGAVDSGTEFSLYMQSEENPTQSVTVQDEILSPISGLNAQPNPVTVNGQDSTWQMAFTIDVKSALAGVNATGDGVLTLKMDGGSGTPVTVATTPFDGAEDSNALAAKLRGGIVVTAAGTDGNAILDLGVVGDTFSIVGNKDFQPSDPSKISWEITPLDINGVTIGSITSNSVFEIESKDAVSGFSGSKITSPPESLTAGPTAIAFPSGLQASSPATYYPGGYPPIPASSGGVFSATMSANSVIELDDPNTLGVDVLYGAAAPDQELTIRYVDNTMYDTDFQVLDIDVDGAAVGRLTSVDIGTDGLIQASFTNGKTEPLGRVALARFNNEQGLLKVGNTSWVQSVASGDAIAGQARSGTYGDINSATLEQSNVDLSTQLVDLIIAQRNYQANARSLEVDSTIQQTILQIR